MEGRHGIRGQGYPPYIKYDIPTFHPQSLIFVIRLKTAPMPLKYIKKKIYSLNTLFFIIDAKTLMIVNANCIRIIVWLFCIEESALAW
jgi:hypothetical protein